MVKPNQPLDPGLVVKRKKYEFQLNYTPGTMYVQGVAPAQQPVSGHRAFIETLRGNGSLLMGGAFPDNTVAIDLLHGPPIVSIAGDSGSDALSKVQALIAQDPGVASGILAVEVRPWDIVFGTNVPL